MGFISLQPNQTFHGDLVKRVVICPLCWLVVANFRAAIYAFPSVVVIACWIHHGSVMFSQAVGRITNHHLRAGVGIIWRDVNSQDVLFVVVHVTVISTLVFPLGSIHVTRPRKYCSSKPFSNASLVCWDCDQGMMKVMWCWTLLAQVDLESAARETEKRPEWRVRKAPGNIVYSFIWISKKRCVRTYRQKWGQDTQEMCLKIYCGFQETRMK